MNFVITTKMQVSFAFLHCESCIGGEFTACDMVVISLLMFLQIEISRLEDRVAISLLVVIAVSVPIVL